jgi:hypothetical protein
MDRGWAMRNIFRKILAILDGTPAVYGDQNHWRGQSVVELSLVTPILIVLLMGLAEIGWFANNYLILLEVTRVGARLGTTLTGELSPLSWDNDSSRSPYSGWADFPTTINGLDHLLYRNCEAVRGNTEVRGFYNHIACLMTQQMDPLVFDDSNLVDDIVISAFSMQAVDPSAISSTNFHTNSNPPRDLLEPSLNNTLGNNKQVLVVGRYPTNANECTVDQLNNPKEWERDPFDFFKDSAVDFRLKNPSGDPNDEDNRDYVELKGYDPASYQPYVADTGPQPVATRERQRGWVLTGQHPVLVAYNPATGDKQCIGSDWSIKDMETMMNLPAFSLLDPQRQNLPNQGVVLVEMFWQHELLLKNPVFNPVWTILGNNTTISVWAAFPLSTTEPRLNIK